MAKIGDNDTDAEFSDVYSESIHTENINGDDWLILNADNDDLLAHIQEWHDRPETSDGDTLVVPNGSYWTETELSVEKDIHLRASNVTESAVRIDQLAAKPFITGGPSVELHIEGFHFSASNSTDRSGVTWGVRVRGQSYFNWVGSDRLHGDAIQIVNEISNDNANKSGVKNAYGIRNKGGVVMTDASGVTTDVNALDIHILSSFQNEYAAEIDGWGNYVEIQHCEGPHHDYVVRDKGTSNHIKTVYVSGGPDHVLVCESGDTFLEMHYSSSISQEDYIVNDGTRNNKWVHWGDATFGGDYTPWTFAHDLEVLGDFDVKDGGDTHVEGKLSSETNVSAPVRELVGDINEDEQILAGVTLNNEPMDETLTWPDNYEEIELVVDTSRPDGSDMDVRMQLNGSSSRYSWLTDSVDGIAHDSGSSALLYDTGGRDRASFARVHITGYAPGISRHRYSRICCSTELGSDVLLRGEHEDTTSSSLSEIRVWAQDGEDGAGEPIIGEIRTGYVYVIGRRQR